MIGKAIKLRRIEKGIKLKDLAKELMVSSSYLSAVESGRKIPSEPMLKEISSALCILYKELFYLKENYIIEKEILKAINLLEERGIIVGKFKLDKHELRAIPR